MRLVWSQSWYDSYNGLINFNLYEYTGWTEMYKWTHKITFHAKKLFDQTVSSTMYYGFVAICPNNYMTLFVNWYSTSSYLGSEHYASGFKDVYFRTFLNDSYCSFQSNLTWFYFLHFPGWLWAMWAYNQRESKDLYSNKILDREVHSLYSTIQPVFNHEFTGCILLPKISNNQLSQLMAQKSLPNTTLNSQI